MANKAPVLDCPSVMSVDDVAGILKVPVKKVRAMLHEESLTGKGLHGTKAGRNWRITKASLERFLK